MQHIPETGKRVGDAVDTLDGGLALSDERGDDQGHPQAMVAVAVDDDAMQWGWDVVKIAVGVVAALSLPAVLFPELILSGFIHQPGTLALAKNPLRLAAGFLFIDSVGMVLMNALTGVGDTKRVMFIGVSFQWLLFLPLVYLLGPVLGFGLVVIFGIQAAYRALQAVVFAAMWKRGRWQEIELH